MNNNKKYSKIAHVKYPVNIILASHECDSIDDFNMRFGPDVIINLDADGAYEKLTIVFNYIIKERLSPREQKVILDRVDKDLSLYQIATEICVGQQRVREIECHALRSLRGRYGMRMVIKVVNAMCQNEYINDAIMNYINNQNSKAFDIVNLISKGYNSHPLELIMNNKFVQSLLNQNVNDVINGLMDTYIDVSDNVDDISINDLDIDYKLWVALQFRGIEKISQLTQLSMKDFMSIVGVGKVAVYKTIKNLVYCGYSFPNIDQKIIKKIMYEC